MEKKRSVGIIAIGYIISMLFIYFGAIFLIAGYNWYIKVVPLMNEKSSQIGMMYSPQYLIINFFGGVLVPLFGMLSLVGGFGTLLFKNWARKLLILLSSIRLLFVCLAPVFINYSISKAISYGVKPPINRVSIIEFKNLIEIAILIILIYFLTRPKVKALFSPPEPNTQVFGKGGSKFK